MGGVPEEEGGGMFECGVLAEPGVVLLTGESDEPVELKRCPPPELDTGTLTGID